MSDVPYFERPFLPMTQKEHPVCDNPMACSICMSRCYEDRGGHFFPEGDDMPCTCKTFPNIKAALDE